MHYFLILKKLHFMSVGADPCVRPQGKVLFHKKPMRIRGESGEKSEFTLYFQKL